MSQFKTIFEQAIRWCDVIVLYSVPTNGLQTILSSKLSRKPVLFHSFDVLHRMTEHDFLRTPTWAMERIVYRNSDRLVVISQSLKEYMKRIGIPEKDITVLPPAVDTQRFNPKISGERFRNELGVERSATLALFSGWLYEFSGLDQIILSLKNIIAEVPSFKLVVCGEGPQLNKLEFLRQKLAVQDSVVLVGRRRFEEMPEIVASANICINPYLPEIRSNFAFPSKIAEYMASGKPVIATDLPGTRSFLTPQSGVILVRPEEFVRELKSLALDENRRNEMGQLCRQFCESEFSLESITDRFETLLDEMMTISQRQADHF
jgi:glycosyltransferase involved in cell wall biosynthesis